MNGKVATRKTSLKKEVATILDNAQPLKRVNRSDGEIYVAERINEYGFKCTYQFREESRNELLRRAGQPLKKTLPKNRNGEYIQKGLLFLERNKDVIQTLCDINYLMREHNYDIQEACRILFKDKKVLPPGFHEAHSYKGFVTYHILDNSYTIERLIELVPMLPIAWLKEISE